MAKISIICARIKNDLEKLLDASWIEDTCKRLGYRWRQRILGPVETVHLFILQLLAENTALNHLRHLAGAPISAQAICDAKARLPLSVLRDLAHQVSQRVGQLGEAWRWKGHRVVGVDASGFTLADTPELREYFGLPSGQKPECSFPIAKMLALFDLGTGMLLKNFCFPLRRQEICLAGRMLKWLARGDVLVGDKAFKSFAWFQMLFQAGIHLCAHLQNDLIVYGRGSGRRRKIKSLGRGDMLVRWEKPLNRTPWMSRRRWKKLEPFVILRQVACTLNRPGFRVKKIMVLTTLLDRRRYPGESISALYFRRWTVEGCFRDLKQTLNLDALRVRSIQAVKKEMASMAITYNLLRLIILDAAEKQEVNPWRISFIDAVRWLLLAEPGAPIPPLIINPSRPGRSEPRRVKRRPKSYYRLNKPRAEYRRDERKLKKVLKLS